MEVMEEGNLMDRVQILLQRDLAYYEENQSVLQENLCLGVVGGLLDFPRYASFASVKLVMWWEEEYFAAFHKNSGLLEEDEQKKAEMADGVMKTSTPSNFVSLVDQSSWQLLEHLHTLTQEALDHADLTVLTGTLGAAALIKNSLWCYNEQLKKDTKGLSLHRSYKLFHEMVEALAERLLDLHCRLLSLYVLQDAESLHWENLQSFFEGERGSFVVQMWWFYMQATKEDLWNTVPPKTAQRVLAGMLNESLTILTVRYSQAEPSHARSQLLVIDLTNLLLAVRHILPAICSSGGELIGLSTSNKVIRDIHVKCHELFCCLVVRGCPLATLYKTFRKGINTVPIFGNEECSPSPWFVLVSPVLFPKGFQTDALLPDASAIAVELIVLVAQPEACWPLVLKVLLMRKCLVASVILRHLMHTESECSWENCKGDRCDGFLCSGGAGCSLEKIALPHNLTVAAIVHIVTSVGGPKDLETTLLPLLENVTDWGCMDRRQLWNQQRPPWLEALIQMAGAHLAPAIDAALQEGVLPDQTLPILLGCLKDLAGCFPPSLYRAGELLEDTIPADVHPLGGSVVLQLLFTALYSRLIERGDEATALGEKLCNFDEDIYEAKLEEIVQSVKNFIQEDQEDIGGSSVVEDIPHMAEVLASNLLLSQLGQQALKIIYKFLQHNSKWLLGQLEILDPGDIAPPLVIPKGNPAAARLLHTMFHMGAHRFDEFLHGTWQLDWNLLLHTPLSLSPLQMWIQLSRRAEFKDPSLLSEHDSNVVKKLTAMFNAVKK